MHFLLKWLLAASAAGIALGLPGAADARELRVIPPGELQQAPSWPVSGRYGWMPDKKSLRFGAFGTSSRKISSKERVRSDCNRGCWHVDLLEWMETGTPQRRSKRVEMSFTQTGPNGLSARVITVDRLDTRERVSVSKMFGKESTSTRVLSAETSFAGTIDVQRGDEPPNTNWRFVMISEGSEFLPIGAAEGEAGWAEEAGGKRISMRPLTALEDSRRPGQALRIPHMGSVGVAFEYDNLTVGAVSLINNGHVWLHADEQALPADVRIVIAALASTLLARRPPE
ncbi:hypothetical protein IP84_12230 [beta proteobacterium AAP99]|nr:hypothetical protein IP84_12230 [beta proteobacterium AAP99]